MTNLTSLQSLSLHGNRIEGAITLTSWPSIEYLFLYDNAFTSIECTGSFPLLNTIAMLNNKIRNADFSSLANLTDLTLASNELQAFPTGLPQTVDRLNLFSNNITGTIPSQLVDFSKLKEFRLSGNRKLSGTIPSLNPDIFQCDFRQTCLRCDGLPAQCGCFYSELDCSASAHTASILVLLTALVRNML